MRVIQTNITDLIAMFDLSSSYYDVLFDVSLLHCGTFHCLVARLYLCRSCKFSNLLSHWIAGPYTCLQLPAKQTTKKAAGEGLRRRLSDAEVRSFLSLQNRDISV